MRPIDRLNAEVATLTSERDAFVADQADVIARLDATDPDPNA